MAGAVDAFSYLYDAIHGKSIYDQPFLKYGAMLSGKTQMENTQASLQAQIDYEQYLKDANSVALAQYRANVPNRNIANPAFSYGGQIRRADTSITRALLDYSTADANYYGNLPYRAAGLYGIGSRVSRYL